jgi:hypothetical protein
MGEFCEKGKYLLLEITRDDYVLYYILKYIPPYVTMYWPSTTTCQTHTKGPKYFYQSFCGHHPYPYLQYLCLKIMIGPLGGVFHFQGGLHANYMRILWYHKYHRKVPFRSKIFDEIFLHLNERKPNNIPKFQNFMVIGQFLFFGLFGIAPPSTRFYARY